MQVPSSSPDPCVVIKIGGIPIALKTSDPEFIRILHSRFSDYISPDKSPEFIFDVDLAVPPDTFDVDADAEVWVENGEWRMSRGDFRASWNPASRQGKVLQTANPYSIDSVLRIVHTLVLARSNGFLLHASSGVRRGRAYMFSGLSEAGKTTIASLAPPDVDLLTDEASYVRKVDGRYMAYGTPFAGEFGKQGKNTSAPIAAVYLLAKAAENRIDPVPPAEAIRRLMRNVLFFAHDDKLVHLVFESVCAFVAEVPVLQLSFFPDHRVWDLIGAETPSK
ncbi:MAG TPA: hypothetical protein VGU23_03365 [Acidobacteriaceae bacterium]|nr:hypothetical protein [Acidobacteriaceae bacterium]